MTFRFNEGLLAVDISVSATTLSVLLTKDGVKQVQYNFFKSDPRSFAASNLRRLGMDLRRDGYRSLADRVELALFSCENNWYDPESAYDSMLAVLSDDLPEPVKIELRNNRFEDTWTGPLFR